MTLLRRLASSLGRWPIALGVVALLGLLVLLPGLGSPGLWEPIERTLADRVAPRQEIAQQRAKDEAKLKADQAAAKAKKTADELAAGKTPSVTAEATCPRQAKDGAYARTLQTRAPALGTELVGDTDFGRRLPLAVFGLLTVLAVAGIAMRTVGPRAGILSAIIVLSFPLLVLQSRQLTSEIGTVCGATLIVYGLVAIGRARGALGAIEAIVALGALAAGIVLGFFGGGMLLGLIVPIGAFAAANALGVPAIGTMLRGVRAAAGNVAGSINPRLRAGRQRQPPTLIRGTPGEGSFGEQLKALVATVVVIGLIYYLARQLYELRPPYPGMMPPQRSILGVVIAPTNCWSNALGGLWKADDDIKVIFDSTFEQIAYGTFPWGILAPIAMAWLLRSSSPTHRRLGALTLAWTAAAWIAGEVFSRKVGFTIWAGFPPMAIAIGAWLDAILTERRVGKLAPPLTRETGDPTVSHGPTLLVGLFVAVAILDFGKDLQSFTERLTSLLVGTDAIVYATKSRLFLLPTRAWILILGLVVAISFAIAMIVWRPGDSPRSAWLRKLATRAAAVAIGSTIVMAAFWSFVWHPHLAKSYSSKAMFEQWHDLKRPGDQLVVMGDMGDAPTAYAGTDPKKVDTREQIVAALGQTNRVFAIAPQGELCTLHRDLGGKPYYVLDDRNLRSILLSNRVAGSTDKNGLRDAILHAEPQTIKTRPKVDVIFDKKIQLLGWDIPATVGRGDRFQVKMYYKILAPVGGTWTSLMHFDGGLRFNGDHKPIGDRCPTSTWMPGDFIIDTHTVTAGGASFTRGKYDLWVGFFTGSNPNWKNMPISAPPATSEIRDTVDRVKITSIVLD